MKTMKYRSVYSTLCAAALSVFLFTACEKESDNVGSTDGDRLDKFKRLEFTGSGSGASGSTSSSSGSGTFIGGGGSNLGYVPPTGPGNSVQFSPAVEGGGEFTDPMSTGPTFAVATAFNAGGGTFSLGSKTYDLALGFCASDALFGAVNGPSGEPDDIEIFVGVAGDFDFSGNGEVNDTSTLGIDMILYAFSYNGGSNIGDFDVFEGNGDPSKFSFVIAVTFGSDGQEDLYFAKSGSVDFSGGSVGLSGLKMAKVTEDDQGFNTLESSTINASGFLECIRIDSDVLSQ